MKNFNKATEERRLLRTVVFLFTEMIDTFPGPERRAHKRIKVNYPVFYKIEGPKYVKTIMGEKEFKAQALDVCEGGTGLLISEYIPIKTKVIIKFIKDKPRFRKQDDENSIITLSGMITSVVPMKKCQYRIGVSFGPVTPEIENKFFDLVCLPH